MQGGDNIDNSILERFEADLQKINDNVEEDVVQKLGTELSNADNQVKEQNLSAASNEVQEKNIEKLKKDLKEKDEIFSAYKNDLNQKILTSEARVLDLLQKFTEQTKSHKNLKKVIEELVIAKSSLEKTINDVRRFTCAYLLCNHLFYQYFNSP